MFQVNHRRLSVAFDCEYSTTSLRVAVELAVAWSFVRAGTIRKETACRALGIWSHSLHFTSICYFSYHQSLPDDGLLLPLGCQTRNQDQECSAIGPATSRIVADLQCHENHRYYTTFRNCRLRRCKPQSSARIRGQP